MIFPPDKAFDFLLAKSPSGGAASFKTLSLVTDQDLAEGDIRLADSLGISLWDSAGAIVIEDTLWIRQAHHSATWLSTALSVTYTPR